MTYLSSGHWRRPPTSSVSAGSDALTPSGSSTGGTVWWKLLLKFLLAFRQWHISVHSVGRRGMGMSFWKLLVPNSWYNRTRHRTFGVSGAATVLWDSGCAHTGPGQLLVSPVRGRGRPWSSPSSPLVLSGNSFAVCLEQCVEHRNCSINVSIILWFWHEREGDFSRNKEKRTSSNFLSKVLGKNIQWNYFHVVYTQRYHQ